MLSRGNAGRGEHHQCNAAYALTLSEFFFGIGCPFFWFEHLPPKMSVHVPVNHSVKGRCNSQNNNNNLLMIQTCKSGMHRFTRIPEYVIYYPSDEHILIAHYSFVVVFVIKSFIGFRDMHMQRKICTHLYIDIYYKHILAYPSTYTHIYNV